MGITKGQLKNIVKECLIEILAEGMGQNVSSSINESFKSKKQPSTSSVLGQNASKIKMQSSALKEAIKRESGGNSVMASILADTAENTLQTMLENDVRKNSQPQPTGTIERIVASTPPEDLFGEETASKWAELAFMGIPKK